MTLRRRLAVFVVFVLLGAGSVDAQYFGRNKVQYRTFTFEVLKTEHFDLYFYKEEAEAARIAARLAERWHARLSRFFGHELRGRQPLILYAAASHFRQTNAVEGLIGEGTGGLTEALKRRIVLPMSGSLADTDHVLGHELVHAFQFDLTGADPRETSAAQAPDILQYPLWFVEGMAEYLSLGPVDAQTAMWLRDAALREQLPHIRDLDDPKYFPYRWGHAFWAYVGAKYGDRTVASLIRSAANPRNDLSGLARQLGTTPDALTAEWHQAIRQATRAATVDEAPIASASRLLIDRSTGGGRFNIGPRVSPDGSRVVFYSERDRFSVDLFLADTETGRIIKRLSQSATDPHFDSLEFLNSAGGWSPDNRAFVIAAVRGGRPVLAFLDAASGGIRRELPLPDLDDALNPSFAPDGQSIVFSGNLGGLIDLYRVRLDNGRVERLTADPFADLEPTFTPDGRSVVFVTERYSTDLERLEPGGLRLARVDLATRAVEPISAFRRGRHLSPQVSADGRLVTFIGEPDGVSNLYRVSIDGGPVLRLSSFVTGVAGITTSSPALSSAADGRLAFSVFEAGGHSIYVLDQADIVTLVPPPADGRAALLPGRAEATGDVQRLLADTDRGLPAETAAPPALPYTHGLTLDAIGAPTLSAGVSEFGAYAVGGVSALFSDMLGDRMLGVAAQVGGSLKDFGGELMYLNRRSRWNWATAAGVLPYRVGYLELRDNRADGEVLVTEVIHRQISRGGSAATAYPFNSSTRLEVRGGARAISFSTESRTLVYSRETRQLIERRVPVTETAPALYLAEASTALVHDTSFFGATSPVFGSRSRLELGQSLGSLHYTSVLADWRRYFMPVRPVTVAVRALHYGRYGIDADHGRLAQIFTGYPELVHGYGYGSFAPSECGDAQADGQCEMFQQLFGSRIAVANVEVRAPLAGLLTGEIEYGRVPVEVAAFFDAGLAWTAATRPAWLGGTQRVVRSAGGAARVNVFGLFVIEVAASRPFDRPNRSWQWQVGLRQGF
jgi:Tol biopolymer transport system component